MKQTKKAYEAYLNELYADMYANTEAIDNFLYLTNKTRGKHTTIKAIEVAHCNHMLGALLRKFDTIAFNVGFNDWKR